MKKLLLLILLLLAGYSCGTAYAESRVARNTLSDTYVITEQSQAEELCTEDSVLDNSDNELYFSLADINKESNCCFLTIDAISMTINSTQINFKPPRI